MASVSPERRERLDNHQFSCSSCIADPYRPRISVGRAAILRQPVADDLIEHVGTGSR